jgi:D-arabinose 1-dehydrogenase-like Zn-dependent alcohol dehydrogenase
MPTAVRERVRLTATGWETPLAHEILAEPAPSPLRDQVLVRVEACGVCHRDLLDRAGRFPFITLPVTPGHEVCGRVTAIGPEVTDWHVGDRVGTMHRDACGECDACRKGETSLCQGAMTVLGILSDGGYASDLLLPQSGLFSLPESLSPAEGAVMHCTFGTAWRDLVTLGKLQAGERVLITGGNGGVGAAAVQIGVRLGAEVVAIVRDVRHRAFVAGLGAQHVVVDSGRTLQDNPDVGKVDLALDTVGAPTFPSALRSLRVGGRIVTVGNVVAEKVALNLGYLITYGLSIIGGSGATRREMAALLAMHADRPFHIPIDREWPLSQADAAQQAVRGGGLHGRIILRPQ